MTVTAPPRPHLLRDASVPAVAAGFIAILVGFSSTLVIILTAARLADLSAAQTSSWVWAVCIGSGITSIALSLWTRMPVITAWSTPGAALLVTSLPGTRFSAAVGAYVVAAVAMTLIGFSGLFGKILARVPRGIVAAMLAGILLPFTLNAFKAVQGAPLVGLAVVVTFVLAKRFAARYAVLIALVAGAAVAAVRGGLGGLGHVSGALAVPVWTTPTWSVSAIVGIGIPLALVTMASQNAPGLAVLRVSGYEPNDRLLLGGTGLVSILGAPFGGHAVNLAAITAAICTGPEAHPDKRRRYVAGVSCGVFYLLFGMFSPGIVQVFAALPKPLVAAVAGVALLGAVLTGLTGMIEDAEAREPALITLAVTASGVVLLTIGSAFWGLVAGMASYLVLRRGRNTP